MTKQGAIQTSTYLCTSPAKKFTCFQNRNKRRNIHKANVMTHQTMHQTDCLCHTLPVALFSQFSVYETQTQRWGIGFSTDNMWIDHFCPFSWTCFLFPELRNLKSKLGVGEHVFRVLIITFVLLGTRCCHPPGQSGQTFHLLMWLPVVQF